MPNSDLVIEDEKYQRSLFLFRRDLRLVDNTGLIWASKSSLETIPCFILDPKYARAINLTSHSIRNLKHEFVAMRALHGITRIHCRQRQVAFLAVPRWHLQVMGESQISNCLSKRRKNGRKISNNKLFLFSF